MKAKPRKKKWTRPRVTRLRLNQTQGGTRPRSESNCNANNGNDAIGCS
jgi:hypothetical protein